MSHIDLLLPDFPVTWQNPADAQIFWNLDAMHTPNPISVLEFSIGEHTFLPGWNAAADQYGAPLRMNMQYINTYQYTAVTPLPLPPEELGPRFGRNQQLVAEAIQGQMQRWTTIWEPELRGYIEHWRAFDLRGATLPQLIAHYDESLVRGRRAWEIHFLVVIIPPMLAMSQFQDFYQDLFGEENQLVAYQLLEGFDNKTMAADRGLWRLSQLAAANPEVCKILEWCADHEVVEALENQPAAQSFLAELRAYLDEFGGRAELWNVLVAPSWIEDPSPVMRTIKIYMAQPFRDGLAELAHMAVERERRLAEMREQLKGYPQTVVEQFESALQAAQEATVLHEDHNYWIDQRCMYEMGRVVKEFGRRFAQAGVIAEPNDVFHLTVAEIRAAAENILYTDYTAPVAERKAAIEHFGKIQPPHALGTLPPGPPPDNPQMRANMRFFGGPPLAQTEPDVIRGNPGSPGRVRGVARVLHSLAEMHRLTWGDILVTGTTSPSWTPLFATAAAVVTDTGGVLSPCAMVAREYHIPAVVGTGVATRVIHDGMLVEVDGDAGTVRIVEGL